VLGARAGIPLVLCSSKTRAEIEALQQRLTSTTVHRRERRRHRGARSATSIASRPRRGRRRPVRLALGRPYPEVVRALREVPRGARAVVGFSDMTVGDVAEECGCRCSTRNWPSSGVRRAVPPPRRTRPESRFLKALHRRGLKALSGGRFDHVTGDTTKAGPWRTARSSRIGSAPW
jgi:hypothetical protein